MQELIASILSGDNFLSGLPPVLVTVIFVAVAGVIFASFAAINALVAVYLERKVSAHMQDRLGPMEVGPHGTLQTLADAVKLLLKEDIVPHNADRFLHILAPFLIFAAAIGAFVALPYSSEFLFANFDIGVLFIISITSLTVIAIIVAGWASNNKWSLLGGMRSAAQIVSYEIPTALALLVIIMQVGSLNFQQIANAQAGAFWHWHIFQFFPFNFIAFLIFFIAALAEVNRTPFDLPEAESELVAGFMTEYSGFKWAVFMLSEYANMIVVSGVGAAVFLGAHQSPFGDFLNGGVLGVFWFIGKAYALILVQMWLRWTLPRLRVDQLMYTSWKVLTPFAFACIFAVGLWMLL
jgi:NADH-quinone oxidoreductase subunit H